MGQEFLDKSPTYDRCLHGIESQELAWLNCRADIVTRLTAAGHSVHVLQFV